MKDKLELKFDPHTIEHLGIKMYSQLPYALAELVANSYDASAENVRIDLFDSDLDNKKIIIEDDGDGMSFDQVRDEFLIIGRKRRNTDRNRRNSKGRVITGKKGIGKLALFGIGKEITIETTTKNEKNKTVFRMNWDEIINNKNGEYYPDAREESVDAKEHGTKIILTDLSRKTAFDNKAIAISLSKLFNCFDESFNVSIIKNDNENQIVYLDRELCYEGVKKEFDWKWEELSKKVSSNYNYKEQIKGYLISSEKPMKPSMRGISLYANGRLVNLPGFFGYSEAGHTFSYISGWIEADYLDELNDDIISTDRQSLNWDMKEAIELQQYLHTVIKELVSEWSEKRRENKIKKNSEKSGINLREWLDTVPHEMQGKVHKVIDDLSNKSEIDELSYSNTVKGIYEIVPPYTFYHYRMLHKQVQDASDTYYKNGEYYNAVVEAMKRYKNVVKNKSGIKESSDVQLVSKAFGNNNEPLKVARKYLIDEDFDERTIENIEEGQKHLSIGMAKGVRNVLSHEEHVKLQEKGLFTEKDCLDILSLLSHLFKRLDEAKIINQDKQVDSDKKK